MKKKTILRNGMTIEETREDIARLQDLLELPLKSDEMACIAQMIKEQEYVLKVG